MLILTWTIMDMMTLDLYDVYASLCKISKHMASHLDALAVDYIDKNTTDVPVSTTTQKHADNECMTYFVTLVLKRLSTLMLPGLPLDLQLPLHM